MSDFEIPSYLVEAVFKIVLAVIAALLAKHAIPWLATRKTSAKWQAAIAVLADAVDVAVRATEQTTVRNLRAAEEGGQGKLSTGQAATAFDKSWQELTAQLTPERFKQLADDMGITEDALKQAAVARIEAKVLELKQPQLAVSATVEGQAA